MTDLHPLRASLAELDRLTARPVGETICARRPERVAPRVPAPLPAVLVERVARMATTQPTGGST